MLKFNFNPFPILKTERLILRQITLDDAEDYFEMRSDPRVMKYQARPIAKTIEESTELIENGIITLANNKAICWAICLKDHPKCIGTIGFYRTQFENYRPEIGYEMHAGFWGKGLASEAVQAALDYAFFEVKAHSVEANIDPKNIASAKILDRNNFIKEGHFRENYLAKGKFTDSAIYSLLKSRHIAMTGKSRGE